MIKIIYNGELVDIEEVVGIDMGAGGFNRRIGSRQKCYTQINTLIEGVPMAVTKNKPPKDENSLASREPILTKQTDLFGRIDVFAPDTDPSMWADLPWIIRYEKSDDGDGRQIKIKAQYVGEVFLRPHFLENWHRFGKPDKEN